MLLDASAIIAMLGEETEGDVFADALEAATVRLTTPIAIWESVAGLVRQYTLSVPEARRKVADFLAVASVTIIPFGPVDLEFALDAYDQFGKGRHPAILNMGDCFVYAAAKASREPLLHKDDGFWMTDIEQAMEKR